MNSCHGSGNHNIFKVLSIISILGSFDSSTGEGRNVIITAGAGTIQYPAINCRKHTAILTDFGGVGDGKISNTKAFQSAIANLSNYASDGGSHIVVPPGKWLTGSFNLTSHFTLFLPEDAVLLASQDEAEWPILPPLPSYGKGRDATDERFSSFIFGTNLTDVVITGNNGTIDGQGASWWEKFHKGQLKYTRPYLIELLYSHQIQISNLTLINSPSWNVHPTYSRFPIVFSNRDVLIQWLTIVAPVDSPNTDGIDPDSCTNTRIEDCYIVSGDDCIAVKSGWDEYGIKYGMPTKQRVIKRLTCISPDSATITLGSEMSGGILDVRAKDITAINTQSGARIKTAKGRGGYVKDIFVRRMYFNTVKYVFWMTGSYDPNELPNITDINYRDVIAENVTYSARLEGIEKDPFTGICISNATMTLTDKPKELQWNCTNVAGGSNNVTPKPCDLLPDEKINCPFPNDKLPIENVELKMCSAS